MALSGILHYCPSCKFDMNHHQGSSSYWHLFYLPQSSSSLNFEFNSRYHCQRPDYFAIFVIPSPWPWSWAGPNGGFKIVIQGIFALLQRLSSLSSYPYNPERQRLPKRIWNMCFFSRFIYLNSYKRLSQIKHWSWRYKILCSQKIEWGINMNSSLHEWLC